MIWVCLLDCSRARPGLWKVVHFFLGFQQTSSTFTGFDWWTSSKIYNAWSHTEWMLVEMLLISQLFLESYHDLLLKCIHNALMNENKGCVCDTVALPFTLKSILRQKKNYGNSNKYFTTQKYNLQKIPLRETKILQDIITL